MEDSDKQGMTEKSRPGSWFISSKDKSHDMDKQTNIAKKEDASYSQFSMQIDSNDGNNSNHSDPSSFKFSKLPKRKMLILAYSTLTRIMIATSLSIFNPIFPKEAGMKHLASINVTVSYSILFIVVFITSPIIGQYVVTIGPKFLFISSVYVTVVVNFCFAALHYGSGDTSYVLLVIISRVVLALATSANFTVTQAVISYEFQHTIGAANGILQAGAIFGFVIGPALAGFLYEAGGYPLPFYVVGIATAIAVVVVHSTLPDISAGDDANKAPGPSVRQLLRSPLMIISLLCSSAGMIGMSNLEATLTNHLTPFGTSMAVIGLIFALMDALDTGANFVWSYLIDKKPLQNTAIMLGLTLSVVGFLVLGPSTLVPFIPSSMALNCIALSIIGIGFGTALIPALKSMMDSAEEMGYDKNDLALMSTISGLFNSAFWLGGFLGLFVIGIIQDSYDTVTGYTVISGFNFFLCLVAGAFFIKRRGKKNERLLFKNKEKNGYSSL